MWIQRQYPLPFKSLRGRPFDFWRKFFNTKFLFPSWNNISLVCAFSTLEEKFHTSARQSYIFYFFQWRKFFPWYFLPRILFPRGHYAGNFFYILVVIIDQWVRSNFLSSRLAFVSSSIISKSWKRSLMKR